MEMRCMITPNLMLQEFLHPSNSNNRTHVHVSDEL